MIRCTDKYELYTMFPIRATASFQTTGVQDGMVIRFRTFYLKIYDHQSDYAYIVEGYRYHQMNPVFIDTIPVSKFRNFAAMFDREDYLSKYSGHLCHRDMHHHNRYIR